MKRALGSAAIATTSLLADLEKGRIAGHQCRWLQIHPLIDALDDAK